MSQHWGVIKLLDCSCKYLSKTGMSQHGAAAFDCYAVVNTFQKQVCPNVSEGNPEWGAVVNTFQKQVCPNDNPAWKERFSVVNTFQKQVCPNR